MAEYSQDDIDNIVNENQGLVNAIREYRFKVERLERENKELKDDIFYRRNK